MDKIRKMIKNPLAPINLQTRKEINFFSDFIETAQSSRLYTCQKLKVGKILAGLDNFLLNTRNILAKVLGESKFFYLIY